MIFEMNSYLSGPGSCGRVDCMRNYMLQIVDDATKADEKDKRDGRM